ncbi:MAG: fibronectin type III domain-containing protein [Actinomycetota bacterium]
MSQRDGFWDFSVAAGDSRFTLIHASGGYVASCDGANASVVYRTALKAPAKPATPSFTVAWADSSADASWTYEVQYRIGSGAWRSWKHGTTKRSATFSGATNKTYFFEARATAGGGTTNWSPARKVAT